MLCLYRVIAICVCLLCFGAIAQAETAAPPTLESVAQENARLRQEVEALQKLLQDVSCIYQQDYLYLKKL